MSEVTQSIDRGGTQQDRRSADRVNGEQMLSYDDAELVKLGSKTLRLAGSRVGVSRADILTRAAELDALVRRLSPALPTDPDTTPIADMVPDGLGDN